MNMNMNMNMELVFDIVFNNESSFCDITAEKAKMLVCTYKPAVEQINIITPIESDKGCKLCNLVYNNIGKMIIKAKYTMFQNRKNSEKKTVDYDIDFTEIVDEYNKLSDIAKKKFDYVIVSDYLEFLKTCSLYMYDEDVLIAEKYKNLLDILDIEITKDIIANYPDSTMDFGNLSDFYIDKMLEIHADF